MIFTKYLQKNTFTNCLKKVFPDYLEHSEYIKDIISKKNKLRELNGSVLHWMISTIIGRSSNRNLLIKVTNQS